MFAIMRYPSLAKLIRICMVLFALSIPAIVIYVYETDATVLFILRYILQEIRTLPYYTKVYIPFETNAGNYFFGMLAGNVYFIYKDNELAFERLKLNMLLLSGGTFFVMMNFLTIFLPEGHPICPSIIVATFGTLLKGAWGVFPAILILYLAFKNPPSRLTIMLRHPCLYFISKLSFTIYLVQYGVVYTIYRNITYPVTYDGLTIVSFIIILFIQQQFSNLTVNIYFSFTLHHLLQALRFLSPSCYIFA
ncbi:uncharacterized protein LOC125957287 isoform X1 [Anopheles darlingi]|uniref:uncharacterized protein LOC125957287 isoform X1 n=1 Tax=Anopheles darlingi TaxID=43151 RepID=UPI002100126E|nr:uncharacterized protein LOC125957287 isoform X1 [Anopheles darlingi]